MPEKSTVGRWIEGIKEGDPTAAQALWERYFEGLVRFARRRLEGASLRVADEEDVALSAFKSFCKAAERGRFPDLTDREDLWRLLLRITARKATDLIRYGERQKRQVRGESAMHDVGGIAQVVGDSPTPEFAAMAADEFRRLLDLLEDPDLQTVALAKMEGYTNPEIAGRFDCSLSTVERRLRLIRKVWEEEVPP